MGEGALTNEDVIQLLGDKVGYGAYKTYRVLDSLDGVPLDTRIPLSEWVPPIRMKVLFIVDSKFFEAWIDNIDEHGLRVGAPGRDYFSMSTLDGHWMRIV